MRVLNDYFEKIYCINLDKRPDRWESAKKEFLKHNINVERYSAVDGKFVKNLYGLKSGEFGCLSSHLNILKNCQKNNIKNVFILEDDVEFCFNLTNKFLEYIEEVPKWDMLYFGANHALCNSYESDPPIRISDHVYRILHAYSTHAYAVNSNCYQYLIDNISKMLDPLDVIYSRIQKNLNVYLFRPHLAWQIEGYSDIVEDIVDYSFLKN